MFRSVPPARLRRFPLLAFAVAAATLASCANSFAAAEAHYAGASARLAGRLSFERHASMDPGESFPILRLAHPVSLLRRSQYPGDAPRTETSEILLRGTFSFTEFASCAVAATGILDFQTTGWSGLPIVEMQVQRIECPERGLSAGTTRPDPLTANVRLDPYACEPSPRSSVWFTRKWSPYSDADPDLWKAADLLMRDDPGARWPFDLLRSLTLRLSDARARLVSAFPDAGGEWEMDFVPRLVEVELAPELLARLEAVEVEDGRIRKPAAPVDPPLEKVCEAVCGCTVILDRNGNGTLSIAFSPTTNLLYAIRRLRELPDVRSARLVRIPRVLDPGRTLQSVLRVRALPAALHFTLESTAVASGEMTRRLFVVDEDVAREVSPGEASTLLSFDPPPLPADAWR
jgi:hypothetical protein